MDIFKEIVRERDAGRPSALVSIITQSGSTPSATAARMLVRADGSIAGTVGGGAAEGRAIMVAREVIATGQSQMLAIDLHENPTLDLGMICGGHLQFHIEAIMPNRTVYIFGGGHVGFVTEQLCRTLGLETVVIDDRPEFANPERFPAAASTHAGSLAEATAALSPNASSLVFIATRGHALDQEALAWALGTPAGYIGMIGSRRKVLTVYNNLTAMGFDAEAFARVRAPVGLDIGAEGPEEIAVAVTAEMIAHIRGAAVRVRPLTRIMGEDEQPKEAALRATAG
jgi:xanthine dehydrogenase accessory factor